MRLHLRNLFHRDVRRRLQALSLLLLWVYGCQPVGPHELTEGGGAEPGSMGTVTAAITSQFMDPSEFDERWGLPLEPRAGNMTLDALALRLGESSEVITSLRKVHPGTATVRFLEAYSREYPTFLKGNQVYLPKADGVILKQEPVVTVAGVQPGLCDSSHLCNELFTASATDPNVPAEAQLADILVLLAWDVEVAGPVFTEGRSLFIISEHFRGNGHAITTKPRVYRPKRPDPTGAKASNGRGDHHGGAFLLYTNVLDKLSVLASGLPGEDGLKGNDYEGGQINSATLMQNSAGQLYLKCEGDSPNVEPQDGGNGGNGGSAGPIRVRYTTLIGSESPRLPAKTTPVSDWQCFSDPALGCASPRCSDNPSVAICDVLTESDNAQCQDNIDNDGDGLKDCADPNCSGNPFVTICPQPATATAMVAESTPEACSDGIDNDGDSYVDCNDFQCKSHGFCGNTVENTAQACADGIDNDGDGLVDCQDLAGCSAQVVCGGAGVTNILPKTTGYEESTNATCSNGLDDDGDGYTDCADAECKYNSLVTVCTTENSLAACTDGFSNDGDGFADCNDFDCSRNPYVKVCTPQYYPFLAESTNATCSDGVDNDGDKFKDCNDFQCDNNPLVTVCGDHENTMAECSDGIDNDGDHYADCADDNCRFSPFFGDYLCRQEVQTGHTQVAPPPSFNGNYVTANISLYASSASRGVGGQPGKALSTSRVVSTPVPCDPTQDPGCSPYQTTTYTCTLGRIPAWGSSGTDGKATTPHLGFVPRRTTDVLRTQLSPTQWVVDVAVANTHFKNAESQRATFLYLHTLMRLHGVLAASNIERCSPLVGPDGVEIPLPALTPAQALIAQNVCPTLERAQLRLTHLRAGLDFYGESREPRLNPRNRYEALHDDFMARFDLLKASVERYEAMANATDLKGFMDVALTGQVQTELERTEGQVAVADLRVNAARMAVNNLQSAVSRRQDEYNQTHEALQTYQTTPTVSFGSFLLDLGKSALAAFGTEFLAKAGDVVLDTLLDSMAGWFGMETGKKEAKAEEKDKSKSFFGSLASAAGAAAGSALKKAFAETRPDLLKVAAGLSPFPQARTTIGTQVEAVVASESQRRTINEYLDLLGDLEKAKVELVAAQVEAQGLRSHTANLRRLKQQMTDYSSQQAALSELDRLVILQQSYAMTMTLLDDLSMRYWKVVRQAQYEKLPFGSNTGANLLPAEIGEEKAFTFLNYLELKQRLVTLKAALNNFTSGQRPVYRRVTGNPFTVASTADMEHLGTIGFPGTVAPYVFHLPITYAGLPPLQRNQRVRDVRVNLLGSGGGTFRPTVYLVRNTLDAFSVGVNPADGERWIIEFELTDRDRAENGSVRSPLHHQSLLACSATPPACDLTQVDTCRTPFQDAPTADACSLSGPAQDSPNTVTFYDRSFVGNWMVVIPASDYANVNTTLGGIQGVELVFDNVAMDL